MKDQGDETETRIQEGDAYDKIAADSFPASDPPSYPQAAVSGHSHALRLQHSRGNGAQRGKHGEYLLPTKPLASVLPVKRLVSQGSHVSVDGLAILLLAVAAGTSKSVSGRVAYGALATVHLAATTLSHCEFSLAKVLPLEVHEAIDYGIAAGAGVTALTSRSGRLAGVLGALVAGTLLVVSPLTDYRTRRGLPAAA